MKKIDMFFISKVLNYLKREIYFFNVRNANIRDLAFKNYCYKRMYKKYKKIIEDFKKNNGEHKKTDYIWICWFQGIDNAPELVKACVNSVKKNFATKQIIILDDSNLKKYVDFPQYIIKKRKRGLINDALFSDLIRLQLLNKYGGLWIDATVYVSDKIDENFWNYELFVFKEMSLFTKEQLPIKASNWLIYSYTNNNILSLTEKLLYEYYRREWFIKNYYIFHLFFSMACEKFQEEWNNIKTFPNVNNHILQFELLEKYDSKRWEEIKQLTQFHKLNRRIKTDDKESNYYHIIKELK